MIPTLPEWEGKPEPPKEVVRKIGKAGLFAVMTGPPYPAEFVDPETPRPTDYDYFHELITFDEFSRVANSAVIAALTNGPSIALTAVMRFGTDAMKKKVVRAVLMGEKMISLAISEPQIGSDVRGMTTTATKDGSDYIVNGNKKWITNGMYADWHVTGF